MVSQERGIDRTSRPALLARWGQISEPLRCPGSAFRLLIAMSLVVPVSSSAMGGCQMVQPAGRPSAVDFVEALFRGADGELSLEDIRVVGGAAVVGSALASLHPEQAAVLLLVGHREGRSQLPPPDLRLRPGDVIAATSREQDLAPLEAVCAATALAGDAGVPHLSHRS